MSLIPYLHQRPIFFKANSIHASIVVILELIRGAQCLIDVIRSSGEEMWRVDAYQIPYYSRGIEEEKRTHPRFADWFCTTTIVWKKRRACAENTSGHITSGHVTSGSATSHHLHKYCFVRAHIPLLKAHLELFNMGLYVLLGNLLN